MIDQNWIETCATAGEFLYGYYPVSVLQKLYQTKKGCTISRANLVAAMEQSDGVLMDYRNGELVASRDYGKGYYAPFEAEGTSLQPIFVQADKDGNPYASLHLDDDERVDLLVEQGDVDFYIPTAKEIVELVENSYIRTPEMTALEKELERYGGDPSVIAALWAQVSTDKTDLMDAIKAIMTDSFVGERTEEGRELSPEQTQKLPTRAQLNALMPLINGFLNSINLRARRGWRPNDLHRKTRGMMSGGMGNGFPTIVPGSVQAARMLRQAQPRLRAMGANVDFSSIASVPATGEFGEKKRIKVGRNDPCPCGSGKKYKKCHGRNRV